MHTAFDVLEEMCDSLLKKNSAVRKKRTDLNKTAGKLQRQFGRLFAVSLHASAPQLLTDTYTWRRLASCSESSRRVLFQRNGRALRQTQKNGPRDQLFVYISPRCKDKKNSHAYES